MIIFNKLLFLTQISVFITNYSVLTANVNRYHNRYNRVYDHGRKQETNKYTSDKCEIKIVTSGVCSVNNHLIKPIIQLNVYTKVKQTPAFNPRPRVEERDRNRNSFKFEEANANNLVDEFLVKFKEHFGPQIDPMLIKEFGKFKLKKLGTVRVYDLSLKGISNMKREGSVRLHSDSEMKLWSINSNLSIEDITADFKVDTNQKKNLFINGWTLQVLIRKVLLNAIIEFDATTKMMSISSLMVNALEGFTLNSENLSYPFSQVIQHVLDHQMTYLKTVISTNVQKYLKETLRSFDVTKILDNMNSKNIYMQ